MKIKKKGGMNRHRIQSSPVLLLHGITSSDLEEKLHNVAAAAMEKIQPTVITCINAFITCEGAYPEVIAYFLDRYRFAGVPQSALLNCYKPFYGDEHEEKYEHGSGFTNGDDVEGQFL